MDNETAFKLLKRFNQSRGVTITRRQEINLHADLSSIPKPARSRVDNPTQVERIPLDIIISNMIAGILP